MSLIHAHITPASRAAIVETALLKAFNTTTVTDISLLAGGLSGSSVYKIVVNDRPYVLKLDVPSTAASVAPSENLHLATAAGIAPPMYYQDAASGIAISAFVNSQPIRTAFAPAQLTSELARTIKAIHAVPINTAGNDLRTIIDGMIDKFRQSNMLSGTIIDECFSQYASIRDKYPWNDTDKVFSHNDLNPGNILCDGKRIWIVDWDTAFLNDRYIDLANAANFFVHTEELEKTFLDIYFDNETDDYKTARFYIMRQVCRIIYAMLMFGLASQSKSADYQHEQEMEGITLKEFSMLMGAGKLSLAAYEGQFMFGKALLNEAVHQMRTPRFAASLAQLG